MKDEYRFRNPGGFEFSVVRLSNGPDRQAWAVAGSDPQRFTLLAIPLVGIATWSVHCWSDRNGWMSLISKDTEGLVSALRLAVAVLYSRAGLVEVV